jgi:hypothetical protein
MLCVHFVTCYVLIFDSETCLVNFNIVRAEHRMMNYCVEPTFTCTIMYYSHKQYIVVHVKLVLLTNLLLLSLSHITLESVK